MAVFDSWNTNVVDNNPTCSPFFAISQPHMITYIDTYHWNGGQGTALGGTISLQNGNGETFGPWSVEAKPASGVDNAWWIAYPNVVIPEGNYMIIDSQPETWSMNSESPCGFAKVEGYAVQADPVPEDESSGQSESKGTVRADIVVDGECDNLIEVLTSGCDAGLPDIPVELTFTYIPPAYSDATPVTLRERMCQQVRSSCSKPGLRLWKRSRKEPCRTRPMMCISHSITDARDLGPKR
jgi:hypothetical protein